MLDIDIQVDRTMNITKLKELLVQTDSRVVGMSQHPGFVTIHFDDKPDAVIPPEVMKALNAALAAHDPVELTQQQQREAAKAQSLQALQGNKIALVLAAIASDAGDIETDLTALGNLAVLNLPNFRPLMTRLLNRQARILNRLEIIVKVLSHE